MFTKASGWRNQFPKLKGRAADVKGLVPALAYAWSKLMTPVDENQESIMLTLKMSTRMDSVLDSHPAEFVLPPGAAKEFRAAGFMYLNQLSFLANRYNAQGAMLFNRIVKSNMVAHICLKANILKPAKVVLQWREDDAPHAKNCPIVC